VPVGDLSTITVPESLRSLIASRLDALDPADRALVQDASVVGEVVAIEALVAIAGGSADELEPRLRDLARRELLDVERDHRSPDRGQYKFVQSLIREVAYGTLARRDRRARHLALARHYESLGDDQMAGALASHYLAAREASDPGPEADAITAQARLALTGAADRASSLGAYDQAIDYLDQALGITTEPAERAPLLDQAAEAAAVAARPSTAYAEEAVETYRQIGDQVDAVAAVGRLGKALIEGGEIGRARDVLGSAAAEAESLGDDAALASILANLARAEMRLGHSEESVAVADRALGIAERGDLEAVYAEAIVNKAAALSQLGRRRESVALYEAALRLADTMPTPDFALRVRNNLAGVLADEDPVRGNQLLLDGAEQARKVGARGQFNWLTAMATFGLRAEGRDWDGQIARINDALEAATVLSDRLRLLSFRSVLESTRGERLDEIGPELDEMLGDSTDPDHLFEVYMAKGLAAVLAGDHRTAYELASKAAAQPTQNAEGAQGLVLKTAMWDGDQDRMRSSATAVAQGTSSGPYSRSFQRAARGVFAWLDGRREEAVSLVREAIGALDRMGAEFDAAEMAVDAAVVMPGEPEIRRLAEHYRPVLVRVGARPYIERLDAALASAPLAAPASMPIPVESPTPGSS
jgi:tetratricopeptide (TPR) repeat protein